MLKISLHSKKITVFLMGLTIFFLVVTLLLTIMVFVFDEIFMSLVLRELVFLPGRILFENWKNPTIPIYLSVYIFNVTNEEEILRGGRPRLQQVGPYVYRERRSVKRILFSDEEPPRTVDYLKENYYEFKPELSIGDPAQINVTIPDLHFADKSWMSKTARFFYSEPKPFVTIDGYTAIWDWKADNKTFKVGFFTGKNDSKPEHVVMETGAYDVNRAGQIREMNGKRMRTVWKDEEVNLIKGIQGIRMPPSSKLGAKVDFQLGEICRSLTLQATEETKSTLISDISVLKFTLPSTDELYSANHWTNRMYCDPKGPCTPKGLQMVQPCLENRGARIPIYMSWPHFMGADKRIAQKFDGLIEPNHEEHSTYLLAEPTTGLPVEAYIRSQVNLFMHNKNEQYKEMAGPFYFPIVWIEVKIITPREALQALKINLLDARKSIPFILSIGAAMCGIITLLLIIAALVRAKLHKRHGCVNLLAQFNDVSDSPGSSKKDQLDFRIYHTFPSVDSQDGLHLTTEANESSSSSEVDCESE